MINNRLFLIVFILFVVSNAIFADESSDTLLSNDTTNDTTNKIKTNKTKIVSFRFLADFSINPYLYNPHASSNGNGINWSAIAGVRIKQITIACGVRMNYLSFNSATSFGGAWNIIAGSLMAFYKPRSWFEFNGGIGASWYSSSFNYKTATDKGIEHKDEAGLSLDINFSFTPWKYITIKTPTRLDLFFNSTGHTMTPYFYGAVRVDFHPYFKWLNLYVETGVIPWLYSGNYISAKTGMFVWSIGTSIDFDSITTVMDIKLLQSRIKPNKKMNEKKD